MMTCKICKIRLDIVGAQCDIAINGRKRKRDRIQNVAIISLENLCYLRDFNLIPNRCQVDPVIQHSMIRCFDVMALEGWTLTAGIGLWHRLASGSIKLTNISDESDQYYNIRRQRLIITGLQYLNILEINTIVLEKLQWAAPLYHKVIILLY